MEEFDEALGVFEGLFDKSHSLIGLVVLIPQTQVIIAHPFYSPDSAAEFEEYLKRYCLENNVSHFYIGSEAWASKQADREVAIPPSLDPDREEILVVTKVSKEGDTVALAPIIGTEAPARFLGNWKKQTPFLAMSRWDACLKFN